MCDFYNCMIDVHVQEKKRMIYISDQSILIHERRPVPLTVTLRPSLLKTIRDLLNQLLLLVVLGAPAETVLVVVKDGLPKPRDRIASLGLLVASPKATL